MLENGIDKGNNQVFTQEAATVYYLTPVVAMMCRGVCNKTVFDRLSKLPFYF